MGTGPASSMRMAAGRACATAWAGTSRVDCLFPTLLRYGKPANGLGLSADAANGGLQQLRHRRRAFGMMPQQDGFSAHSIGQSGKSGVHLMRRYLFACIPLLLLTRSEEHTSELQSPCNLV